MASGEVRVKRKKKPDHKFLIGDGLRWYWNEVFDHNPFIIKGTEINKHKDICWINNYEGNRPYRKYGNDLPKDNYNWNENFKPKRGEIFFSEKENRLKLKKSIVTSEDLKKGQLITIKNIAIKRPGDGIRPIDINKVLKKKIKFNLKKNTVLKRKMIK